MRRGLWLHKSTRRDRQPERPLARPRPHLRRRDHALRTVGRGIDVTGAGVGLAKPATWLRRRVPSRGHEIGAATSAPTCSAASRKAAGASFPGFRPGNEVDVNRHPTPPTWTSTPRSPSASTRRRRPLRALLRLRLDHQRQALGPIRAHRRPGDPRNVATGFRARPAAAGLHRHLHQLIPINGVKTPSRRHLPPVSPSPWRSAASRWSGEVGNTPGRVLHAGPSSTVDAYRSRSTTASCSRRTSRLAPRHANSTPTAQAIFSLINRRQLRLGAARFFITASTPPPRASTSRPLPPRPEAAGRFDSPWPPTSRHQRHQTPPPRVSGLPVPRSSSTAATASPSRRHPRQKHWPPSTGLRSSAPASRPPTTATSWSPQQAPSTTTSASTPRRPRGPIRDPIASTSPGRNNLFERYPNKTHHRQIQRAIGFPSYPPSVHGRFSTPASVTMVDSHSLHPRRGDTPPRVSMTGA